MDQEKWTVSVSGKALKQLLRLPVSVQDLADLAMVDLETFGPTSKGWNVKKTDSGQYRLRLNYRHRMRYRVAGRGELEIEGFFIGHGKDANR